MRKLIRQVEDTNKRFPLRALYFALNITDDKTGIFCSLKIKRLGVRMT